MSNLDVTRSGIQSRESEIPLHGPEAFEGMRKAGQLAAAALDMLAEHVAPGVSTEYLDDLVFEFAMDHGALPATLHYRGYPKSCCTSINHVVCHGIPGPKPMRNGDIINIDVTLILDGWHGDTSRMYPVGTIARKAERLIDVTLECLKRGVAAVKPGNTTGTSARPFSPTPKRSAAVLFGTSVVMASDACFTTDRISSITAEPARGTT